MKILFLIDNLSSGGAQRQMVNLSILFKEKGHQVRFCTYNQGNFFKHFLDKANIVVDHIESVNPIDRILKIRKYIRNGNQDVVISFLETPNFIACISCIGGRKWKLITNELSAKPKSFTNIKGRIFKWFERFSDRIVCNSLNAQKLWEHHYPKYQSKLFTIYNPVIITRDNYNYEPLKEGKVHLVIAASYQYLKNINGLIEAVNMLSDKEKDKLKIYWYGRIEVTSGDTEAYDEAVKKVNEYKLTNISLNDATKEITPIMANADFICLFSKVEGLPNAICEGMALGKPIIMSKVSDYNLLVDEGNGFLCDAESPESIKEALLKAINLSSNQIISMGENSSKKAEKLFSKNTIIDVWLNLIKSIE